jgi:DNA-directed RNA polymerase subunit RPC12/RpoP
MATELWAVTCFTCGKPFPAFVPDGRGFSVTPCPHCGTRFFATRFPRPYGLCDIDLGVLSHLLDGALPEEAFELAPAPKGRYRDNARIRLLYPGTRRVRDEVLDALRQFGGDKL